MSKKVPCRSLSSIHILYNHDPVQAVYSLPGRCSRLERFHWTEVVKRSEVAGKRVRGSNTVRRPCLQLRNTCVTCPFSPTALTHTACQQPRHAKIVDRADARSLLCGAAIIITTAVIFSVYAAMYGRPVHEQASGASQHNLMTRQSHRRLHTLPTASAACC